MTFLRVIAFSIVMLLVFTGFANVLPQVQSDPPKEEKLDTGALDMAGMIAYGERLFSGDGTCTLCHNSMGRAPDLLQIDLAADFQERLNDPKYTGEKTVEAYIRESMVDPSAYVVPGYGKKGTNDTESPMPAADKPPIGLNEVQMNAITAFLMDLAGMEPTVPLPTAEETPVAKAEPADDGAAPAATTGIEAIEAFACSACHNLEGSEADLGPDLHGIAQRMSKGEIMEAILDPNAIIAEGYEPDIMPQDFAEQMTASELLLIVDYLMNLPPAE